MFDAMHRARRVCAALVLAVFCTPAFAADPLTLLLLRLLRDKIISTVIESAVERAVESAARTPAAARSLPGVPFAGFDDAQLRRLIDEGFVHLTPAQRGEVHASVRSIIADPKNAAAVPSIIADLALTASAVRQAHERLNTLSFTQKRSIANEAREEYEKMPIDMREQMASVLRQRLVPLPSDLTDMILGEFDRVRATQPPPAPPVAVATPAAPPESGESPPAKAN